MGYTDKIRSIIKRKSTKKLISEYKQFNADGRLEARRELKSRGVVKSKLPYKKRKVKRNTYNYFGF